MCLWKCLNYMFFSLSLSECFYNTVLTEYDESTDVYPKLVCVITGKGPLKYHYQQMILKLKWNKVSIITPWLEHNDYPIVLGKIEIETGREHTRLTFSSCFGEWFQRAPILACVCTLLPVASTCPWRWSTCSASVYPFAHSILNGNNHRPRALSLFRTVVLRS